MQNFGFFEAQPRRDAYKERHGIVILKNFSNPTNFVEHTHLPFKGGRIFTLQAFGFELKNRKMAALQS